MFCGPNLVEHLTEGFPWDFAPANLDEVRALPKPQRRGWAHQPDTAWNVYTAIRGAAASLPISKENQAAFLHGLVADYDMVSSVQEVLKKIEQLAPHYRPCFIEISLSKKIRLVWPFERPLPVNGSQFATDLIRGFFKKMGVPKLLSGYDESSEKPSTRWTNGGEWYDVNPDPMPWDIVLGMAVDVAKKIEFTSGDIPLEQVAERVKELFPGRWHGEFKLNAQGVRFWDASADNETGAQVKPDGMLCFTGDKPFVYWREILGNDWVNARRSMNLAAAASDTFFDGRTYWRQKSGVWRPCHREDVLLALKARGISAKAGKGQTISDAEKVLNYIQENQHIDGAAPLINYRPGPVEIDGSRLLNISSIRALEPASQKDVVPQRDFPWIWHFLHGLLHKENTLALAHFLAWLQRFYRAAYHYIPSMGQAIFLCGPHNNGKTLLCMHIIKPLVGNKCANPFDYFTGITNFNSDLFTSPLLAVNDEEAPEREAVKQKFLARIKAFVVNPSHTYEPKYCNRVATLWTGRIFVTLNDDPNSVGILPEVNVNTQDKLMFHASHPFKGKWGDRQELEARIKAELPFFARWLMDIFEPPAEVLCDGRMGVRSYFDPRILELSKQQIHAYNLLELLAVWCRTGGYWVDQKHDGWEGTPSDLMAQFSLADQLIVLVRDWRVAGLAKALATLARLDNTGVKFVEGSGERSFKITRSIVLKTLAEGKV